ncbi:MAG: CHASE2 domain-containing protein [bacterium]|nr:CHASE2 domain-containing protein [bacterium]
MAKETNRFWGIKVCLAPGLIVILLFLLGVFDHLEDMTLDLRFRLRGKTDPGKDIIIVGIDENSLQRLGRWPWPRSYHSKLIDYLAESKAKVIGMDLCFAEPSLQDKMLIDSASRAGNIIHPVFFAFKGDGEEIMVVRPFEQLSKSALSLGHIQGEPEVDGILRRLSLARSCQDETYLSFSLEVARNFLGIDLTELEPLQEKTFLLGPLKIPVDRKANMVINYAGKSGTFKTFSYADVLEEKIPGSEFKDKIVLIGITSKGISDEVMTPFSTKGNPMSGVEVQANAVRTILNQDYIHRPNRWVNIFLMLFLSIIVGYSLQRLSNKQGIIFTLCLLLSLILGSFILFKFNGIWLDIIAPPTILVSSFVFLNLFEVNSANKSLDNEIRRLSNLTADSEAKVLGQSPLNILSSETIRQKVQTLSSIHHSIVEDKTRTDNILSSIADGILVTDCRGIIIYHNSKFNQMLDIKEEIINTSVIGLIRRFYDLAEQELEKIINESRTLSFDFHLPSPFPKAYNFTLVSLKDKQEEVIGTVGILHDVTYLREIDRTKSEFVSNVSHELRTPLTTIKGSVELLLGGAAGELNEKQRKLLTINANDTERLIRLINDLLDVSKIESGKIELDIRPINILDVIRDSVDRLKTQSAAKDISLAISTPPQLPLIYADFDKIGQVFTNLIDNAVKFTPPTGSVTIQVEDMENELLCKVIDTGAGIPESDFGKIFDKFQQLKAVTTRRKKGTGLGLSICKGIVEEHHGKIWVESEVEKGSEFVFTLPK